MLKRLAQKYKIECDRCGKEHVREEGVMDGATFRHIAISDEVKYVVNADLCGECYEEFCVYTENFFDEVNKHDNI